MRRTTGWRTVTNGGGHIGVLVTPGDAETVSQTTGRVDPAEASFKRRLPGIAVSGSDGADPTQGSWSHRAERPPTLPLPHRGRRARRRPTCLPGGPGLVDEMLGASQTRPVGRDRRLAGRVAPFPHGSKRATGLDRSEEPVNESELTLDDEVYDVVRKVWRVRPKMRTDDARLAFPRNPRREVPPVRGLPKRHLHRDRRYAGDVT